jgi:hypothetical protein
LCSGKKAQGEKTGELLSLLIKLNSKSIYMVSKVLHDLIHPTDNLPWPLSERVPVRVSRYESIPRGGDKYFFKTIGYQRG